MALQEILARHELTQAEMVKGTGLPPSAVSDIVNGKRCPTTGTVNKVLAWVRTFAPETTYDELFGDAPEAPASQVA